MRDMVIPPRLRRGDAIGFISPSAGLAPLAPHRIERAQAFFEREGYRVIIAPHALLCEGYVSASVEERVADLHWLFKHPDVKLIMATIGGNHCIQLLKHLDFNLIREHQKLFVGYSDMTILHYAFFSQARLASYYGPCAMTQFGEYPVPLDYTCRSFFDAVCSGGKDQERSIIPSIEWTDEILNWFTKDDCVRTRALRPNSGYQWLREGQSRGPLLGGAIPTLTYLIGSPYWIDPTGSIFFIDHPEGHTMHEGLSLADIDTSFAQLDLAGVFDCISGLIIGRPYHFDDRQLKAYQDLVLSYARNKKYPILYGADIGHTDPIVTLRYGSEAVLDSQKNKWMVRF